MFVNQNNNFQNNATQIQQNAMNSPQIYYTNNLPQTGNQLQPPTSFNAVNPQLHFPANGLMPNSIISSTQFPANPQFAPIIYYVTPPVSPSSSNVYLPQNSTGLFYSSPSPSVVILKGAPANITVNDILQFFNGYEVTIVNSIVYLLLYITLSF